MHIAEGVFVAAALAVGTVIASGNSAETDPAQATAAAMTVAELVGQRIVTGYTGATPSANLLRAVRRGRVGGVILFQDNIPYAATARGAIRRLQREARTGKQPPLLVMVDQEGGDVKRIPGAPPRRSPAQIGASGDVAATARAEGRATGRALAKIGFNVDLAPVADVPDRADSFLGDRAFSRKAATVATAACAFVDGLGRGSVAATFKHFPGLGRARANTDDRPVKVAAPESALRDDLEPYRRCPAVPSLAMVASATYPSLGIATPAVMSPRTYALLDETGFSGLTISDAFDTLAIAGQQNAARRALVAGLELLLYAQTKGAAARAHRRLLADAGAGRLTHDELVAGAARVIELKNRLAAE